MAGWGFVLFVQTKIAPRQVQLYTLAQVTAQPKHRGSEAHEREQKVLFSVNSV